jgi:hypothetical protein
MAGVKQYDRSVVREAYIGRLLATVARTHKLPFFSPVYNFAYLPLAPSKVFIDDQTGVGHRRWASLEGSLVPHVLLTP